MIYTLTLSTDQETGLTFATTRWNADHFKDVALTPTQFLDVQVTHILKNFMTQYRDSQTRTQTDTLTKLSPTDKATVDAIFAKYIVS